jgi:SAM-dependent methyltransferase
VSPVVTVGSGGVDRRRELLPAALWPLFDDRFVASCDLHEEYVVRLAIGALVECGLADDLQVPSGVAELAARHGLDPGRSEVALDWLLRLLAGHGLLDQQVGANGVRRFATTGSLPVGDPTELEARQREVDPSALPTYRVSEVAARHFPAFLRGEVTGEAVLFGPDHFDLWPAYFSNANPLYAVNNAVVAAAARELLATAPGSVLELGGGLGSGTEALLDGLAPERLPASYRFTEIAPIFLRRARRGLEGRLPGVLTFAALDMDRPFADQGVAPASQDLVVAVNTLHVARDLRFTLGEVWAALEPGGLLLLGECLRPFDGVALHTELVFNLLEAFRAPRLEPPLRPNGGFLTPEQWLGLLEISGFVGCGLYPDLRRIRDVYPAFLVGAVSGRRPA